MVREVEQQLGPVDILVNNAGITRDRTFHKMTPHQWTEVINTNLNSVFNMTRPVIEGMRERKWGRVIQISSINGQKGQYGQANYAAAKAGMHGFTISLAQENARFGITVNTVSPGYIGTDMVMAVPEEVRNKIVAQIPTGRLGNPDEIAYAVGLLHSRRGELDHGRQPVGEWWPVHGLVSARVVRHSGRFIVLATVGSTVHDAELLVIPRPGPSLVIPAQARFSKSPEVPTRVIEPRPDPCRIAEERPFQRPATMNFHTSKYSSAACPASCNPCCTAPCCRQASLEYWLHGCEPRHQEVSEPSPLRHRDLQLHHHRGRAPADRRWRGIRGPRCQDRRGPDAAGAAADHRRARAGREPMLSTQLLSQIIRFYGDSLQGFMGSYLERSMQTFLEQQQQFRQQMGGLLGQTPVDDDEPADRAQPGTVEGIPAEPGGRHGSRADIGAERQGPGQAARSLNLVRGQPMLSAGHPSVIQHIQTTHSRLRP